LFLEQPRFINQSEPIQIAAHYSTVNFICQVYGVPNPTVTWYKVVHQDKQINDQDDLKLLSVNSQKYEYSISFVFELKVFVLFFSHYSYTLENVDDRMAGRYRCIGKNRLGMIQNEFQLLIRGMSK